MIFLIFKKTTFPKWESKNLYEIFENYLDIDGINLISQMLVYDPLKRITAKQALNHQYFKDVDMTYLINYKNT